MSEPASSGAAGIAGWKLIGGAAGAAAIGAGLAAVVVMCMQTPRSPREWAVGLITTVIGSVTGGANLPGWNGMILGSYHNGSSFASSFNFDYGQIIFSKATIAAPTT